MHISLRILYSVLYCRRGLCTYDVYLSDVWFYGYNITKPKSEKSINKLHLTMYYTGLLYLRSYLKCGIYTCTDERNIGYCNVPYLLCTFPGKCKLIVYKPNYSKKAIQYIRTSSIAWSQIVQYCFLLLFNTTLHGHGRRKGVVADFCYFRLYVRYNLHNVQGIYHPYVCLYLCHLYLCIYGLCTCGTYPERYK